MKVLGELLDVSSSEYHDDGPSWERNGIDSIHKSKEGLVAMEDVLKGEGGNAIRSFYQECHLPSLQFFMLFQGRFTTALKRMDNGNMDFRHRKYVSGRTY